MTQPPERRVEGQAEGHGGGPGGPPGHLPRARRAPRRRATAALFAASALLALALAVAGLARPVAAHAEQRARDVAVVSAGVYASLRTINAAISLVQEAQLGASLGVSGSVRPLAWLDPVDDTVERAAAVIFWIALVAGVLSLALAPLSAVGWLLVSAACALRAVACLWPGGTGRLLRTGERGVFVLGAGFLLLPLVLSTGLALGERLTADRWKGAMATLGAVTAAAEPVVAPFEQPPEAGGGGLIDGMRGSLDGMREAIVGFYAAAGTFRQDAQALFLALLTISGVFVLRMIVLPAALLWAALVVLRRLV